MDTAPDMIEIIYQETHEPLEMKEHFHNSCEIIYVTGGKAEFSINNRLYCVEKNCIAFINNLESHEIKVTDHPYKRFFILIKPEYLHSAINEPVLTSIFKHRPGHFEHVIRLDREAAPLILDIVSRMYKEAQHSYDFSDMAIRWGLNMLFIELYRSCRTCLDRKSVV